MRSKIIFSLVALLPFLVKPASAEKLLIRVAGGINLSSLSIKNPSGSVPDQGFLTGPALDIGYQAPHGNHTATMGTFGFESRGAALQDRFMGNAAKAKLKLNYMRIGLAYKFATDMSKPVSFYLAPGAGLALQVGSEAEIDDADKNLEAGTALDFDLSAAAGCQFALAGQTAFAEAGYTHGFLDNAAFLPDVTARNRAIQLKVGMLFGR